ncbi:MAG: siphovirus Gp157 family protein [Acidaminococcaceae bacterium]|nr:siphovirus Gp157 family protein [Acidaminococcaceae bacterium]
MKPLYEIDQEILECVDMESGEILDSDRLTALQMERERKLEGVALWVKDLKAESAAVKEEADKLNARKKALDNKIDGLKNWLLFALGGEKLKTPRCNVYQTHSQRVNVADEPALINFLQTLEEPEKFLRFKDPELKKDEIKKALKDGTIIPGAVLEETESVVIK